MGGQGLWPEDKAGRKQARPEGRLPPSLGSALPLGHGCGPLVGAGQGSVPFAPVTLPLQELFKAFARHLSHSLTQKTSSGKSVKEEAQIFIKQFFHGRARCESEADWHGLCDPPR